MKAEKNYYADLFNQMSGNIKETWSIINKILHNGSSNLVFEKFNDNGVFITNGDLIADKFNKYFINIGSNLASGIPVTSKRFSD